MISMIWKMSAITILYVLLTALLWIKLHDKKMTTGRRLAVGLIFGICSVLSTHFGVDYGHMMINVRDIGPLAAGLFFDPASGIIAGLIGGIERYVAGRWWGIGSYTRVACAVSTCLAGFLAAFMNRWLFKGKKPSVSYAFFMGATMEVFHMYSVLITHRDDMSMAYQVVMTCSIPMILFTGVGMGLSSLVLLILSGQARNPFRPQRNEDVPVARRFSFWLFAVTTAILLVNLSFSYSNKTRQAVQSARETLEDVSGDISETYGRIQQTRDGIVTLAETIVATDVRAIARAVNRIDDAKVTDEAWLESMREIYGLEAVGIVGRDGGIQCAAGSASLPAGLFPEVLAGKADSASERTSRRRAVAAAGCDRGMVEAVIDTEGLSKALNQAGLDESLSYFHVGATGWFDILSPMGYSIAGVHRGMAMNEWNDVLRRSQAGETYFNAALFGQESLCRVQELSDGSVLLALLPMSEVYKSRDEQCYESGLGYILLFTITYVLVTLLVQKIVVNNLDLVNNSLDKITGGDLNEVVDVRDSSEFASLSDDINHTVTVLKGYIQAAEKRIEKELELAKDIQEAALPKNFFSSRRDFELFATMDPAKEVGGDFYDCFFVDNDHLALVIADVSGKGIPAALFMMRSKTAIRSLAESGKAPSEILYKANNTLCDGNDAEMFVTAWIGIVDLRTGAMRCANAGHEYPTLMRAGGEFELFKDKHGLALAAMEGVPFREYEMQLNPGDRLFVYTDGIPEAINDKVEQYGTGRLVATLNALKERPMRQILPAVRQDIQAFAGNAEQFDDITMLGFTYYKAPAQEENGAREEEST